MNEKIIVKSRRSRNTALDLARIIAICCVVMTHSSAEFVFAYAQDPHGFFIGNIFNGLSRPGVPLFLMISGALMLDEDKEKSIGDMLNAVKNIVLLLAAWALIYSAMYNVLFPIMQGETIDIIELIKKTLDGHYHLWYMYMLVGIYIAVPFLRKIAKRENRKLVLFYIAIALCTAFVKPLVNTAASYLGALSYINTFIAKFKLGFFGVPITYYLIGWYVVHIGINKKWMRTLIYIMGGISAAITIGLSQITKNYASLYDNAQLFLSVYSVSIFVFINNTKWKSFFAQGKQEKIITLLSKLSFGIYAIHPMFVSAAEIVFENITNPIIYIPLCFVSVFAVSGLASYVLSRMPILKKLIRT